VTAQLDVVELALAPVAVELDEATELALAGGRADMVHP
jgi:hypothetical protein